MCSQESQKKEAFKDCLVKLLDIGADITVQVWYADSESPIIVNFNSKVFFIESLQ